MKKYLVAMALLTQCFDVQPSHAVAPTRHEVPAYLSEGSHGAWTRCVAAIHSGSIPERCGGTDDLTVCELGNGTLYATQWVRNHAKAYRAPMGQEPMNLGSGVVEHTTVNASFKRGAAVYECDVYMVGDRMIVGWAER